MNLITLQTRQALQLQIQNGAGLRFGQMIKSVLNLAVRLVDQLDKRFNVICRPGFGKQRVFCILRIGRRADQFDDRIQIFNRQSQTDQCMSTIAGFIQFINRAAADDFLAELNKRRDDFFQIHHHRAAAVDSQHIHAEAGLQRRIFIKLVQNDIGLKIAFDLNNDANALTIGLVADIRNALQFLFLNQFGNAGNQRCLVDLIGNFMNNDRFFVLV